MWISRPCPGSSCCSPRSRNGWGSILRPNSAPGDSVNPELLREAPDGHYLQPPQTLRRGLRPEVSRRHHTDSSPASTQASSPGAQRSEKLNSLPFLYLFLPYPEHWVLSKQTRWIKPGSQRLTSYLEWLLAHSRVLDSSSSLLSPAK